MNSDAEPSPASRQREIFLEALEKSDPAERSAYLISACGNDEELRRSVQELLGEERELGSFLHEPAIAGELSRLNGHRARAVGSTAEELGQSIGPYKLLEKIGEGGWGVVYLAQQERPVRRQIALKIIKLGMDTRQVIARFEAERQALALMEHPSIARVFEAGSTETGRPYFVMELVRGVRITDYCKRHNVSTRDRLRLFIQVCHAIEHAHQHGVIHRDIKPSNILVTSQDGIPVPKVIDFGVAKANRGQGSAKHTAFTKFGLLIGTPAYMSPEQALLGETDLDKRSDIYSLGVLLYELLTGLTPFDADLLSRVGLDECRRMIREVEPTCPSSRLTHLLEAELSALARQHGTQVRPLLNSLRGDLDWIIMKALEKDPNRRYATASDLASDVQHYLNDETVSARRPSSSYRFQKLVRRHKQAFALGAVIAVLILCGIAVTPYLLFRAFKAEREARTAQEFEARLRRRAEFEGARAKDQAALARLNEYIADINLANHSLDEGNFGRAVRLLKKHLPQPGESDLRGFEWRFLWQRANEDQQVSLPQQMNCNLPGLSDPLGFSKDSGTLAALDSKQTTLVLIRLATCELEQNFPLEQPAFVNPLRVAVSQDLRTFAEGLGDGRIKLWNTQARENSILKASDRRPLQLVVLSPDGRQMVTGAFQEAFRWWDLASRTNIIFKEGLERICFSGDSLKLAAFGPRKEMQLWDVPSRSLLTNLILESSVVSAVFSPDGGSLATTEPEADENPIRLHETAGGKVLGVLVGHRRAVRSIAYSADGRTLASASDDCTIKLWNVATQQELLHVHLEDGWAGNLKFSPDGTLLVASVSSAANGNSVRLFRAPKP